MSLHQRAGAALCHKLTITFTIRSAGLPGTARCERLPKYKGAQAPEGKPYPTTEHAVVERNRTLTATKALSAQSMIAALMTKPPYSSLLSRLSVRIPQKCALNSDPVLNPSLDSSRPSLWAFLPTATAIRRLLLVWRPSMRGARIRGMISSDLVHVNTFFRELFTFQRQKKYDFARAL